MSDSDTDLFITDVQVAGLLRDLKDGVSLIVEKKHYTDITAEIKLLTSEKTMLTDENIRLAHVLGDEDARLRAENAVLTAALSLHRWIPVEEPPKPESFYWVACKNTTDTHSLWFNGNWWMSDTNRQYRITEVTHWKPIILPEGL